jgi:hypothetical protein
VTFINPRAYWEDAIVDLAGEITEIQDSVQVRLLWTAEHDLDFAAFLVPSFASMDTASLALLAAVHSEVGSVLEELADRDSVYAEIVPGEKVSLLFEMDEPVPSRATRDFIFTSSGYYLVGDSLLGARRRPPEPQGDLAGAIVGSGPNPFRAGSGTRIVFSLPHAQRTSLSVYDVTGRRVRLLEDGVRLGGRHVAWWDGRDEHGRGVAPGMYFWLLQSESVRETKKLVVVE